MEEEIDLRAVILALVRRWRIVAAITLVALIGGALFAFLGAPKYEATAVVAITITGKKDDNPFASLTSQSYALLATSKDLEARVLTALGWNVPLESLEQSIRVKSDGGVIQLIATSARPEKAAQIATTWARLYVEHLNEIFALPAPDLAILEEQVEQQRSALIAAEQALTDFQARNQITSLEQRLDVASNSLSQRLALADRLTMLAGDARSLRTRLQSEGTDVPTAASEFQALLMEALSVSSQSELPLQIQLTVDSSTLAAKSRAELARDLDTFAQALDARGAEVSDEAEALPAQISAIQQQLESQTNEYERLSVTWKVAKESYAAMLQQLNDERLQLALKKPEANLVSQAAVPAEPSSMGAGLVMALALVGGVIMGAIAALVVEFAWSVRD